MLVSEERLELVIATGFIIFIRICMKLSEVNFYIFKRASN